MLRLALASFILLAVSSLCSATPGTVHATSTSKYSRAHSLRSGYQFHPRDGWQHVNVTNLQYKYARSTPDSDPQSCPIEKRGKKAGAKQIKKHTTKPTHNGNGGSDIGGAVKHILGGVWNGLKALGQPEPVTITW